jgi:hypothetical protein
MMSVFCTAFSGVARADTTSVAVLGVEPIEVPEGLAQQLTEALRQRAAGTAGVRAVQGKDLIEIKMVFGCDQEQPACMAQAGRTLGADKLIYGTIRKARGGALTVSLKLLDVKGGAIERSVSEATTRRELTGASVQAAAVKWFAQLVPVEAHPILTVTSDPPNAAIAIDGNPAGRTPVTLRDLSPGVHSVAVSAAGRVTQTRNVELRAGVSSDLAVTLEAERVSPPVVERPRPPEPAVVTPPLEKPQPVETQPVGHPGRAAKLVALGSLVGAVVAGSVAIYTWRTYVGLEDTTHTELGMIQNATAGPPTQDQANFYASPTCNPPAGLMGGSVLQSYQNDCSKGQTYANATTALWVITGALAGTAVISYIVGDRQAAKAEREAKKSQARLWQKSLRIAPVISSKSGGLTAAFEF